MLFREHLNFFVCCFQFVPYCSDVEYSTLKHTGLIIVVANQAILLTMLLSFQIAAEKMFKAKVLLHIKKRLM